jgi:hypothetical protein
MQAVAVPAVVERPWGVPLVGSPSRASAAAAAAATVAGGAAAAAAAAAAATAAASMSDMGAGMGRCGSRSGVTCLRVPAAGGSLRAREQAWRRRRVLPATTAHIARFQIVASSRLGIGATVGEPSFRGQGAPSLT